MSARWSDEDWRNFLQTPPTPTDLIASANAIFGGQLNGPVEGAVARSVRAELLPHLSAALTEPNGAVAAYLGYDNSNKRLARFPIVNVDSMPYAVLGGDLQSAMTLWAQDEFTESWWTNIVAFMWPNDNSWFLRVDPDATFAAIGCGEKTAIALLSNNEIECYEAAG